IQFTQGDNKNVKVFYTDYGDVQQMSIHLRKQIKLKNPYMRFANTKINYFVEGEQVAEKDAYPMEYGKDGKLYVIGSSWEDVYQVKIFPLSEREIIFERQVYIDPFKFEGIYKSLEQYLSLGKPFVYEDGLTGEKYESSKSIIYEEPFSEFKRKNPELLEFLTKGDSIELEVISPVKQKYKFKAEW
ncbi:hypothetical protein, partial [Capnocytophaga catalasegens]|uniref:hypothetical protein n=1 Tax=Capnocytophaga catalasegens TaxID=1004260 RepID=UPI0022309FCB